MQATAILKVDKIRAVQESILVGCDSGSLTKDMLPMQLMSELHRLAANREPKCYLRKKGSASMWR
jgi:hypothetical protein